MALVYVAVARVRGPIQFEQATTQGNAAELFATSMEAVSSSSLFLFEICDAR